MVFFNVVYFRKHGDVNEMLEQVNEGIQEFERCLFFTDNAKH